MVLPLYLAMTAAEIRAKSDLPPRIGWMACHFSPYGTGLSNFPTHLSEGAMLILNDRTPIHGHDPHRIADELCTVVEKQKCDSVLLDFQRPDVEETAALSEVIAKILPCPVGVSEQYARDLTCPVFLPPVPPDTAVVDCLAPWAGREIWLEAALEGVAITLTPEGAQYTPLPWTEIPESGHADTALHCHYQIDMDDSAHFHLFRTAQDLNALLEESAHFGVTRAVGLYQELGNWYGEL